MENNYMNREWVVMGLFDSVKDVNDSLDDLETLGYGTSTVSIILNDEVANQVSKDNSGGATVGATAGAVTGGALGLIAGALAAPIVGPVVVAGAAAATIGGALTGAAAGGLAGALIGFGVSEADAKYIEEQVEDGKILLAVPVMHESADEAEEILEGNHGERVKTIRAEAAEGMDRSNPWLSAEEFREMSHEA